MFLTVEGVEGSGKSTLLTALAVRLEARGTTVLRTREPGGCPLGARLRPLLLSADWTPDPNAELFLFLADRAQHVAEVIRPALAAGAHVLCDRYADSTIAYQGYGRGMDLEWLQRLNDCATGGLWPDLTLVLDLPAEAGLLRAARRNEAQGLSQTEGRFEAESLAFHERIRQGFLDRARRFPGRFRVLDAALPPPALADQAWAALRMGAH
ncbi:MAG: dTMP kinase [Desulfovibrionaceae bacterium]|nr:dTMP kinase [Desulfovibrionaceae bacterium]